LACKNNKKLSHLAYGLAPIHIVLYIRIVRTFSFIWYNVSISIDYRSYIVRISGKRKR